MPAQIVEPPQTRDPDSESTPITTPLRWIAIASLPFALGAFLQRFGEIVYLTRLDRVMDPLRMAARGFDLWNPFWDMGAVQFQQNGYWIPFDLWFVVFHALHVPPWISERLFLYTFLSIALWGFVRLADEFSIGRPITRIAAGFAYACSPVILSRIGWQSPFAMGAVFLPWVLVPLARGSRSGSTRKAAAQSAVAIALTGGASAAATLAIVPVPLLFLLTRSRGQRRASLIRWWIVAVPLATLWWLIGLSLFGSYGPDVLLYTESVQTTTGPTAPFDVLRGVADWVSRLPGGTNPAGFALSLRSIPILATALVTAIGLAGLARKKFPERTFLIATLALGVAAVGGGFGGVFGNPLTSQYASLLEGPLNAFRNVYKFQPLLSLPLALGVASALGGIFEITLTRYRVTIHRSLAVVVVAILALASWPLWQNALTRGPGTATIPAAWIEANEWLAQHSPGRTLVLPGIPDADFEWGFTAQIPIQWGSDVTWATRSQAPLSGVNIIEYLDATESAIERGGDAGLMDYLRRGGFTAVVVPNDQRSEPNGAPPPETIRNAMIASGFELTATFGEKRFGYGDLHQVEIYSIASGAVATTYADTALTWLSGDIESTLSVPTSTFGDRPYLLVRDHNSGGTTPQQWIITDGNQSTSIDYGLNRDNKSYIHGSSDDEVPNGQSSYDRTSQEIAGFSSVTASSVGPGIIRRNLPAFAPANVLDGNFDTYWVPFREQIDGPEAWGNVDPFIEIRFAQPTLVDELTISLYIGPFATPAPISVTVETDNGKQTSELFSISAPQRLNVPKGVTASVRVAIARSSYAQTDDVIGIRDINVPGTPVVPRLVVPAQLASQFADPTAPDPSWVFTRNRPPTSPLFSLNSERQLSREFTPPKAATFETVASGSATRGQPLLQWLGTTPTFAISADSTWGENPNAGPRNLVDSLPSTLWRSGQDINETGGSAILSMRWSELRTLTSMRLVRDDSGAQPTDVVVYSGDEARSAAVAPDGTITFEPLTTNAISMRINYAPVPDGNTTESRLISLSSLDIPSVADLYPGPIDRATQYAAACGQGPGVTIASTTIEYSFTTTIASLLEGSRITLTPCGDNTVDLSAQPTFLDTTSGTSLISIDQLLLGNSPTMGPPLGMPRSLTVDTWGTNDRKLTVGAGVTGLLVVNEAFNKGWKAELNGIALTSIMIDGWRQGFLLPSGEGGVVHLHFAPDRIFKAGTAVGLVTLLFVLVLAIWPNRSRRDLPSLSVAQAPNWLLFTGVTIGALWCTGIGVVFLAPLWWLRMHRRSWLAPVAFVSMSAAGVLVVVGKRIVEYPSNIWGVSSYPVTALAVIAFLSVIITLLPTLSRSSEGPTKS